jgi:hypothetical protein
VTIQRQPTCPTGPPTAFICPLTGKLMSAPVACANGYTYEKAAILKYFQQHHRLPMAGGRCPGDSGVGSSSAPLLIPNNVLMQRIRQFRASSPITPTGIPWLLPPRQAFVTAPVTPATAADIPADCLRLAMAFLGPQDLAVAYKVCLRWALITSGDELWEVHICSVFGDGAASGLSGMAMHDFHVLCQQRMWATPSKYPALAGAGCHLVRSSRRATDPGVPRRSIQRTESPDVLHRAVP